MRIRITKTILRGRPELAWSEFCHFYNDEILAEYTPIQKTAALCWRYYVGLYDGGHSEFFDSCKDVDAGELAQALVTIGTPEFARVLLKAVESETNNKCEKADVWFDENSATLYEAIRGYWRSNLDEFYEIIDENYTMIPPKYAFRIGAIEAILFLTLMAIFAVTNPKDIHLIIPSFFALASLGLLLIAYATLWRVTVIKDTIRRRLPFLRGKTIQIDEISDVKKTREGIVIYAHNKRFVSVNRDVSEFWMLCLQLKVAGKIPERPPSGYSIRQIVPNVEGFLTIFFGICLFVWSFTRQYNPANIYEKIFFTGLLLFLVCFAYYRAWGKITVLENSIIVKKILRSEEEYLFPEMTKVEVDEQKIVIFANNKRKVKIAIASKGCVEFMEKLRDKNITFVKKGNKPFYGKKKR